MNIEQLADDIRAESRQAQQQRKQSLVAERVAELRSLARDEQIARIVHHIRWAARRQNAPSEWYR
jgi:hypothetical protein